MFKLRTVRETTADFKGPTELRAALCRFAQPPWNLLSDCLVAVRSNLVSWSCVLRHLIRCNSQCGLPAYPFWSWRSAESPCMNWAYVLSQKAATSLTKRCVWPGAGQSNKTWKASSWQEGCVKRKSWWKPFLQMLPPPCFHGHAQKTLGTHTQVDRKGQWVCWRNQCKACIR